MVHAFRKKRRLDFVKGRRRLNKEEQESLETGYQQYADINAAYAENCVTADNEAMAAGEEILSESGT